MYYVVKYNEELNRLLCGTEFNVTSRPFNIARHYNKLYANYYKEIAKDAKENMLGLLKYDFNNQMSASTSKENEKLTNV